MWQLQTASSREMRFPSRSRVRSRGTSSPPNTMARSVETRSRAKSELSGTAKLNHAIGKQNGKRKRNRQPIGSPRHKEAVAAKAGEKLLVMLWATASASLEGRSIG